MTDRSRQNKATFDAYAAEYDVALARGISVSGEDKSYFARGRIEWLRDCLRSIEQPMFESRNRDPDIFLADSQRSLTTMVTLNGELGVMSKKP